MSIFLFLVGLLVSALGLVFMTRIERVRAKIQANLIVEEIQERKPKPQHRAKKRPQHVHA